MFFNKKYVAIVAISLLIVACSTVYATNWPTPGNSIGNVEKVTGNIWQTIVVIVQILSVGAVVYAGLRYMFTSAEGRADIKKEMGYLALGAMLVFSTTAVLNFIVDIVTEVLNP